MVSKITNLAMGNAMKKLLLGTATSIAMVATASAADLAVKAPTPAWNWTGCYVGASVGGASSRIATSDVTTTPPTDTGTSYDPGVVGGGQVGCDVQAGRWVIGVEGEFGAGNIGGSAINGATGFSIESKIRWLATATGRLGFLFAPGTLLYARGGGAWSRDSLEIDIPPPPLSTAIDSRSGWTVGAGIEQRFWANVSGFVEFNYADFGSRTVQFSPVFPHSIDENIQEVLVGLNFRFGGDAPIATRY
ncbi:MAG: outer membrane protein [Xanthobacteraceae bacterium]